MDDATSSAMEFGICVFGVRGLVITDLSVCHSAVSGNGRGPASLIQVFAVAAADRIIFFWCCCQCFFLVWQVMVVIWKTWSFVCYVLVSCIGSFALLQFVFDSILHGAATSNGAHAGRT
jgi:hypothetical protein